MLKKIAGVVVSVAPLSAFAAVPAEVDTAIKAAGTDAAMVAMTVFVATLGILVFRWMRREAH